MKNIAILGSTGSIGLQTLEVIRNNRDEFSVCALTANSNIDILYKQVLEFKPDIVVIFDYNKYKEFKSLIASHNNDLKVLYGEDGLTYAASYEKADIVVSAIVGIAGLKPTYSAIEKGKTVALANKETLVTAGRIITKKARECSASIIPVDSEHSAIFQCIGRDREFVSKIILTASGGPFRKKTLEELKMVSLSDALKHPSWSMGKKVTIDSSTLMNKGLEVIEARWLFDMAGESIQVYVHPESIIHSMVEFVDGAILAQLGVPDMKIPIKHSLTYPKRTIAVDSKLDFSKINTLNFEKPDTHRFPCLKLAYEALKDGDSSCIVLNGANEVAVNLFLQGKIQFMEIYSIVAKALEKHTLSEVNTLEEIFYIDNWSRNIAMELYKKR
ncbi:MAG: 1-deoxy-D-xylulose-5-phosphate reductoisomerase [Lutispora sp.]|nr:1-deoxy-D-xylulose-5-phosphate reductoisomerase [Lutispora sp.]MDD4833522.1 1-deoxy-D-xylulose-5-phosphate reductoisomerase [Lutispora sp.]